MIKVLPSFELGIFIHWTCNSMNNLSSYCGLVDAKIRTSDKDLPVLATTQYNPLGNFNSASEHLFVSTWHAWVHEYMNEFMNSYIVNSLARHKVYLFELFWHLSISWLTVSFQIYIEHFFVSTWQVWMCECMNEWIDLYIFNGSPC